MLLKPKSKHKAGWWLMMLFGLLLLGGILYVGWMKYTERTAQVACTQEAKACPDGSYVHRAGPACEFTTCPIVGASATPSPSPQPTSSGWQTSTDSKTGVSFQYPQSLQTEYIHPVDWPPTVQVLTKPFTCTIGGKEIARAGQTAKLVINGHTYCVTKATEGAAGSVYTSYAYAFTKDSKTIMITFSLRAVQCANYDEPQKTACEKERTTFDINTIVDRIAQSVKF